MTYEARKRNTQATLGKLSTVSDARWIAPRIVHNMHVMSGFPGSRNNVIVPQWLHSEVELRKLATYLQFRLDRAGKGDLKISQQIVGQFVVLIEETLRYRRAERGTKGQAP